ncbi:MAG TPA: CbrC family protein, partial [Polyangiaceae bacterium]|nr:CbrC family protein [Polyangiaceae bacterium]
LCPWCIADGSAAAKFGATFTDRLGIGDYGHWERVPESVLDEVSQRTPGFTGWQQERWFTCCGDAATFLGRAGREQLTLLGLEALAAIERESGLAGEEWDQYLRLLDRDGSPTAYLFRCERCGRFGGYSDCQ